MQYHKWLLGKLVSTSVMCSSLFRLHCVNICVKHTLHILVDCMRYCEIAQELVLLFIDGCFVSFF